jgi:hypothetical protein
LILPIIISIELMKYLGRAIEGAEHDNETGVLLPDHLPELLDGAIYGGLSSDEGLIPEAPD